ncbi:MAG: hypothetical protein KJP25_09430 [Gammaproteobacteria bacterium]|nr:hypothetical protein [Gammaproteobacteria bacterium]MBT8149881.1 hypothetical protein [Gammaproteobacteria bacterium]NND38994.1 hypothetical protein [Pseudomonadales bacterium]NNL11043.1 hypothetical protein [Pseudomonadales bacterium]NNM10407.1 hypothetical protein [Pseudomonadales bacterium]
MPSTLARRELMLLGLLGLLPTVSLPVLAQEEDLESFSELMIDLFLDYDDAEIEAAAYHDMLGSLDQPGANHTTSGATSHAIDPATESKAGKPDKPGEDAATSLRAPRAQRVESDQ